MKIGILGTGNMAKVFARTMKKMEQVECYAVASRALERAELFAEQMGFEKAYGSYEELAADPAVELVYIATPHTEHSPNIKLCLEHGKPVLCEKALTVNAEQAREIMQLAAEKRIYVSEAIWPRYMPSRAIINELLDSGLIGNITTLTANLSYPVGYKQRLTSPELAGGALLDIGIYGLNFTVMHFGKEIERIESSVQFTDTGVDAQESITIFYRNGRMAVITAGMVSRSDRKGIFYGDKGYMVVENINNPQSISVYDTEDRLIEHVDVPEQISGYEYEIQESIDMIRSGKTQSQSMPLAESVYMLELMDRIRKQWGLVYPMEQ